MNLRLFILLPVIAFFAAQAFAGPANAGGFRKSLEHYADSVKNGAGIEQRISALAGIIKKYENLVPAAKLQAAKTEMNYLSSWKFYLDEKRSGASQKHRLNILERIILKYSDKGLDLVQALKERDLLAATLAAAATDKKVIISTAMAAVEPSTAAPGHSPKKSVLPEEEFPE